MSAAEANDDEDEVDVRVLLLRFQVVPGHAGSLKCNRRNLTPRPQGKQGEKRKQTLR